MRCLIVDDSPNFLSAARDLLERQGVDVVGEASTGAEALRLVGELRLDVTLVDINLDGESGFDVAEHLYGQLGAPPVIMISTYAESDIVEMVAESPAVGYVYKSSLSPEAIRDLLPGRGEYSGTDDPFNVLC